MICEVLESLKVKTATGQREISLGNLIKIDSGKAVTLIKNGKIKPVEAENRIEEMTLAEFKNSTTVLRVYSALLNEEILFSPSIYITFKKGIKKLNLSIYTATELINLFRSGMTTEKDLKIIHEMKKKFNGTLQGGDAFDSQYRIKRS
tara:strand:+ start:1108 stop:1551 length:444 start_codon:yes stop_codon:yes gene_type:complete